MFDFDMLIKIAEGLTALCAAAVLFIKPLRAWLFKDKEQRDGVMCLLRSQMLSTYYHHKDTEEIRQYEYENFLACYKAYKAMGGNSFVDHIKEEVDNFKIIS